MAQTAEGAAKRAANDLGITYSEWLQRRAAGLKWCTDCKQWHPLSEFMRDATRGDGLSVRCRDANRRRYRARYVPVAEENRKRMGPPAQPGREGDKKQARARVNAEVQRGRMANPDNLPCAQCGHICGDDGRRHEYHHHKGYGADAQLDVIPLCSKCHGNTPDTRWNVQKRGKDESH